MGRTQRATRMEIMKYAKISGLLRVDLLTYSVD